MPPFRKRPGFPRVLPDKTANDLAERNAVRTPTRTAMTAAALMIGLALVTFVAVLAAGLKSSFESAVKQQFSADYALTSQNGFTPTDISSVAAVRKLPRGHDRCGRARRPRRGVRQAVRPHRGRSGHLAGAHGAVEGGLAGDARDARRARARS